MGGIPAQTVLQERDRLRAPAEPLEQAAGLSPLVERMNKQLAELLPDGPRFQLRLTATDSESLLRALVPHYTVSEGVSLPVGRHGMGLLSLQTFILLLELGRERVRMGKPFLFAMEEPELHIPPGMQRRLSRRPFPSPTRLSAPATHRASPPTTPRPPCRFLIATAKVSPRLPCWQHPWKTVRRTRVGSSSWMIVHGPSRH